MNNTLVLRVLAALSLVGVAFVHLKIAGNYDGLGKDPLALDDQFYVQAAVAILLAVALVVKPHLLVWLAAVGFAVASMAGLIYSRYKCLPIYGFDGCFQETWSVEGAKLAITAEIATLVFAGAGAAVTYRALQGRRTT
ncbi:MAG: hypothetical protein JWO12_1522 [Frankiales bacterium]|nr:hypothetical protein [Frankiales bacterium]